MFDQGCFGKDGADHETRGSFLRLRLSLIRVEYLLFLAT